MFKFKKILLPLFALVFVGCSDTPKSAISNMYDALQNGNVIKLSNNTTETMNIALVSESLKKCSVNKANYIDNNIKLVHDCLQEEYSKLKHKNIKIINITKNIANVKVTIINNNIEKNIKLVVENLDDKWRVRGRK
ncbi:MAG: hypothetical protein L3J10_01575 [Sulfurimonas sp.]|nr:hypothetical protein [Sulfurimonas sp.]